MTECEFTMDAGHSALVRKRRGGLGGRSSLKFSLTTVESLKADYIQVKSHKPRGNVLI